MVQLLQKHCLSLEQYTADELNLILQVAAHLKRRAQIGDNPSTLHGKTLGMLFQKPSTRTRVSFEVAMTQLGGSAIYLNWNDLQLGRGETIADTARVLGRYVDCLMARLFKHEDVVALSQYSGIPVINGLTDKFHPCQALADLLTIREYKGRVTGITVAYVGDGNNVCHSLMLGGTKLGMHVRIGCPPGFKPAADVIKMAEANAKTSKGSLLITEDPVNAVAKADVIYTDTFVSMGQENETETRLKTFAPYQVNDTLVAHAKEDYLFLHCLPAHRNVEVTNSIIDDPSHSVVWDQAENRLHVQKALLTLLLGH